MSGITVKIKMSPAQAGKLYTENEKNKELVAQLQDFAIWMTGCGYDFCQHEHFCEQRDKLLKD